MVTPERYDERRVRDGVVDDLRLEPEDLAHELRGHDVGGRAGGDHLTLADRDEVIGIAAGQIGRGEPSGLSRHAPC